jgi:ketosteroid isomerase-like protein
VREVWLDFRVEPERFMDADDPLVVVERRRGRGRESDVEVETRSAANWTLGDGRVVSLATDLKPEGALRRIGKAA